MLDTSAAALCKRLTIDGRAMLVRVLRTEGSVPREHGAWMAVWPTSAAADAAAGFDSLSMGTVGGGHLEYEAIDHARRLLDGGTGLAVERRFVLGPSLGQCCGGIVVLRFDEITAADGIDLLALLSASHAPVTVFGGGHVGRALVNVLATLPFSVTWIDSRGDIFPVQTPANVRCEHSEPVHGAVADMPMGSHVVIMSFSHVEDFELVAACLRRQRSQHDLPFIGLIGSKTKWATFRHRLEARGFTAAEIDHITCPIGVSGVTGKTPEVIAVSIAAQLLQNSSS